MEYRKLFLSDLSGHVFESYHPVFIYPFEVVSTCLGGSSGKWFRRLLLAGLSKTVKIGVCFIVLDFANFF